MDQLVNVMLAIDKAHSTTTEGPGLRIKPRWVKPGYGPNHPTPSALIGYLRNIYNIFTRSMYNSESV